MIYTAATASPQFPTNPLFESKKIGNLAQVPLSRIHIVGKPTSAQFAYTGYEPNIEAFLFATASKKKIIIGPGVTYPIIQDINHLPLNSPASVGAFKKAPGQDARDKMTAAWASYLPKWETTKQKKQVNLLFENVPLAEWSRVKASFEAGITLDNRAKPDGVNWYFRVLTFVNLFLQVHTYAGKVPEGREKEGKETIKKSLIEHRIASGWYREGYDKTTKKHKKGDPGMHVDDMEVEDLTPELTTASHQNGEGGSGVFVAKPSLYPTSVNFGTPSEVPFLPGLVFPYFPGLIGGDSAFVRDVVTRRFFRNLGSDPKLGYRAFRSEFGTFPNSPQGKVLTHILLGVDLALSTQGRLFLLFSSDTYLGFVLLGSDFSVFINGAWHSPKTSEELSAELAQILTHSDQLEALARLLSEMGLKDGEVKPTYTKDQFKDTYALATALGRMSLEDKEKVKRVEAIITDLRFPRQYKTVNPANISASLRALVARVPETTAELYIAHNNFHRMATPEYSIFASYGPTAFSFITQGGTKVLLSEDKFGDGEEQNKKVIVYSKKIFVAMDDWNKMTRERAIYQKFGERAQLSRASVFTKDQLKTIAVALKEVGTAVVVEEDDEDGDGEDEDMIAGDAPITDINDLF